jgi:uncharacterized protein YkwD
VGPDRRTAKRVLRYWCAVGALIALLTTALAIPSDAEGSAYAAAARPGALRAALEAATFDGEMMTLINQARASAGVPVLTDATGLDALASWWSGQMDAGITDNQLAHNPNAWTMLETYGASNRTTWGENVGWSSSTETTADQVLDAYMNSPAHKANILGQDFRYLGVGSVSGARGLWITVEFTDQVEPGEVVSPSSTPASSTPVLSTPALSTPESSTSASTTAPLTTTPTTLPVTTTPTTLPTPTTTTAATASPSPVLAPAETAAPTAPALPSPPVSNAPVANGQFVTDVSTGAVYRMAGGAPIYLSTWAAVGGVKRTTFISHQRLLGMPRFPANGTFIRASGSGEVYRIAGGAPVYVASWSAVGGQKPAVDIDAAAVAHSGGTGYWIHLAAVPADGTFVRVSGSGAVYRIAGGAPIYVATWAGIGGERPAVTIDTAAVSHSGWAGHWSHLKWYPNSPTFIQPYGSAGVFQVINGVPTHLTSWSAVGGPQRTTTVHPLAISRAGLSGSYSHLK